MRWRAFRFFILYFKSRKNLTYAVVDYELCTAIRRSGRFVDDDEVFPSEIVYEPRRGIYGERSAAYYERIGARYGVYSSLDGGTVEALFVQNDVGLYYAAAPTLRNADGMFYVIDRVKPAATHAVVAVDGAVELEHIFAARRLMESVDILRYHRF